MLKKLQFAILLLLFFTLLATILLLLAIKILRKNYIRRAKEEIEKIKGKEHVMLYKVKDNVENNLFDLDQCTLIIKGFDTVCDTLRRHWNADDELKLAYTIKDEYNIEVELFFSNSGDWKRIEGLYNLSDGIDYVNRYEINFKVNEKIKSLLETLILFDIALWLEVISLHCMSLFIGV